MYNLQGAIKIGQGVLGYWYWLLRALASDFVPFSIYVQPILLVVEGM